MEIVYSDGKRTPYDEGAVRNMILDSAGKLPLFTRKRVPTEVFLAARRTTEILEGITMRNEIHEVALYDVVAQALDQEAPEYSRGFRKAAQLNLKTDFSRN